MLFLSFLSSLIQSLEFSLSFSLVLCHQHTRSLGKNTMAMIDDNKKAKNKTLLAINYL